MNAAWNILALVAVSTLLAGSAFFAFLAGTGRLNAQRVDLLAKVLRGELDAAPVPGADEHAASQPAADADDGHGRGAAAGGHSTAHGGPTGHGPSEHEVEASREQHRLARAMAERAQRDVMAQRDLLDQALGRLVREQEQFEQQKKSWELTRQKLQQTDRDAGFEEELKLVSKLSPAQAKEHLVQTWNKEPVDAVRLIKSLSPSKAQRILDQLKTPEELLVLHKLLEQLRLLDAEKLVPESGKTSGDTKH